MRPDTGQHGQRGYEQHQRAEQQRPSKLVRSSTVSTHACRSDHLENASVSAPA